MRTITAEEIQERLDMGGNFVVVNVLPEEDFMKKHIPGSINIPLAELSDRVDEEVPEKIMEVIVYCSGKESDISERAAKLLEQMGYKDILRFPEGVDGWEDSGFEMEGDDADVP